MLNQEILDQLAADNLDAAMETEPTDSMAPMELGSGGPPTMPKKCDHCGERLATLLSPHCTHEYCGPCFYQILGSSGDFSFECKLCQNKPASLIPTEVACSSDCTPGKTRHPSNGSEAQLLHNSQEISPLQRAHKKNEMTIFHTLTKFKERNCKPMILNFGDDNGRDCVGHVATNPTNGEILVSDMLYHKIHQFSPSGSYAGSFGSLGNDLGQFEAPYGITVNSTGELFMADSGNHRVVGKCGWAGPWMQDIGSKNSSLFRMVRGLTSTGFYVFCADFRNLKIINFALRSVSSFCQKEIADSLYDVTTDDTFVYASSETRGIIYKFKINGEFVKIIHDEDYENQQFYGLTADRRGNLLVCDHKNECLKVFDSDTGKCDGEWLLPGRPISVAVQPQTMNIVVSYQPRGSHLGGCVALLTEPAARVLNP